MRILGFLLFYLSLTAQADIYQWRDGSGGRHYSDRSRPDSQVLKIKPGYQYYPVKKVYDGDTVELTDGRKIRLLGVDTPEVRHRSNPAQPGGDEAREWLRRKLENRSVRLVTDEEKTDKYGRVLAHLFTDGNDHINLQLVAQGFAHLSVYPPNLLFVGELQKAEQKAEDSKSGIWGRAQYQPKQVRQLFEEKPELWTRVAGQITAVRESRKYVYLQFEPRFSARIEKRWLFLFPPPASFLGKTVEARGWVSQDRGRMTMLIRHPSALRLSGRTAAAAHPRPCLGPCLLTG